MKGRQITFNPHVGEAEARPVLQREISAETVSTHRADLSLGGPASPTRDSTAASFRLASKLKENSALQIRSVDTDSVSASTSLDVLSEEE